MSVASVIFGLSGPRLTPSERAFFRDCNPWAFILFARNIETPQQVRALCSDLRDCVGRDALIFTDQEGGRVQRFRRPHWPSFPKASRFGQLWARAPGQARRAAYLNFRLIAEHLRLVGVTADCAPVLDLPISGADPIISDRAFSNQIKPLIDLSHAAMAGLMAGGVAPVIKHLPGHGRALVDSHKELPVIDTAPHILARSDFVPFREFHDAPMAMTAHILLPDFDDQNPATLSKTVMNHVIRTHLAYKGLVMTDDLDMKALSGDLEHLASAALAAGCDVVLQCGGALPDMVRVAKGVTRLSGISAERARMAELITDHASDFDENAAWAELAALGFERTDV